VGIIVAYASPADDTSQVIASTKRQHTDLTLFLLFVLKTRKNVDETLQQN